MQKKILFSSTFFSFEKTHLRIIVIKKKVKNIYAIKMPENTCSQALCNSHDIKTVYLVENLGSNRCMHCVCILKRKFLFRTNIENY